MDKIHKVLSVFLYILMGLIFVFSLTVVYPAFKRYNTIRGNLNELNEELKTKIEESVTLNREVHDLEHKPSAAEKIAREKFNLCREGEVILKYDR